MVSSIGQIDWKQFQVPAFFTIIAMPLTYSIATGIAVGFIFYPISMIAAGKAKKVHPIMYVLFLVFLAFFAFFRE